MSKNPRIGDFLDWRYRLGDKQLSDGIVIWTSPSGHSYRTVPSASLLVPALLRARG